VPRRTRQTNHLGALSKLPGGRFLATAYSRFGNPIAKEPGSSYPARWRCVSRLGASNGGLDSCESSPLATLSRGAFSASSLVTPTRSDTSRDRVVPACNTDSSLPAPPHTASRHVPCNSLSPGPRERHQQRTRCPSAQTTLGEGAWFVATGADWWIYVARGGGHARNAKGGP